MLDTYLSVLELGYYEVTFAFEGLLDENVWKRPAAGLLSVGELAGHIAYWEAIRLAGEKQGPASDPGVSHQADVTKCHVSSPLVDERFAYYPATLATLPTKQHRTMTAEQVCQELRRVHEEATAYLRVLNPGPDSPVPGYPPNHTYGEFLKYLTFHVSYHTGQMFSVRHLLGERTPDN